MALSADNPLTLEEGIFNDVPLAASATVYEGSMIGDSSGYGRALVAGDTFRGHAVRGVVDTSGVAGTKIVQVRGGIYRLQVTLTSVAVTDVGSDVYASDDGTYTLTVGSNSYVGKVCRYVTTNTCVVEFHPNIANVAVHEHTATSDGGELTSPHVITAICDTNGNELIKVTATGSAVNEITLANGATGNGPTLTASGETNVDFGIAAKGTGTVTIGQATGSVQLGTVATDKIGFFGTTPAVQQSHIADTAGDDATAVNAIIAALETYGILAAA